MVSVKLKKVQAKFEKLKQAKRYRFPDPQGRLDDAPTEKGVYVIYGPRNIVLHVGGTPRGKRGIRQRLSNHLHKQSSFTEKSEYLKDHGGRTHKKRCAYVREHCKYSYLVVDGGKHTERLRALLEAYAIGHLCPDHIGLHQQVP
jgi:hypothetical protein